MLKNPELIVFNFLAKCTEFWPNSDVKSSNGSIPRRHLTFQLRGSPCCLPRRARGRRRRRAGAGRAGAPGAPRERVQRRVRDIAGGIPKAARRMHFRKMHVLRMRP